MTDTSAQPDSAKSDRVNRIVVRGSFELHPQTPLPHLDSPGVKAYAATDMRGGQRGLFVLICRHDLRARIDTIPALRRLQNMLLLKPIEAGVVYWPPENARRLALIFDLPGGKRVMPDPDQPITPWREEEIISRLLQPLAPILRDLAERNICHRGIRADNLFYADSGETQVLLGECVSVPPGLHQPVVYEPVSSAMSLPGGRGNGRPSDDLYSLGVLIAALLGGETPCAGMTDDEIILSKIVRGSYATIAIELRASLPMVEVLRGLLCDDPSERWKSNDIFMWLNGRHLSPKQAAFPPKAVRPLEFCGEEYFTAPSLSFAMGRNWREAIHLVKSGELEHWVRRSLANESLGEQVRTASVSATSYGAPETLDDRLLSRVLMVLDPNAPLRYKSVSAQVEGFPMLLGVMFHDENSRAEYLEVVENKLPQYYMEAQLRVRTEFPALRKLFESATLYLKKKTHGFGIERMLYEFCPGWPCQSDILKQEYTSDFEDLIQSLERIAQGDVSDKVPIDRHITAFCATAHPTMTGREVGALNRKEDQAVQILAMLRLLSEVQRMVDAPPAPHLAAWFRELLPPVVETYHNRETRKSIDKRLDALVDGGILALMVANVDNINERMQDDAGFSQARANFQLLAREVAWLRAGGLTNRNYVKHSAAQAASVASSVLAGITLVLLTAYYAF